MIKSIDQQNEEVRYLCLETYKFKNEQSNVHGLSLSFLQQEWRLRNNLLRNII